MDTPMALGEFELIHRYFRQSGLRRDDVLTGIGDDGAVLRVPADTQVVSAMVASSAGSPGAAGDDAALLGREIGAMALNRLAALGADPAWLTLALSLPEADPDWLEAFSGALLRMADGHGAVLVGGDTTRGPLTVCVVAHGLLSIPSSSRTPAPQPGDGVYVTGEVGDALLATASRDARVTLGRGQRDALHERLSRRAPRLSLGHTVIARGGTAMDLGEGLREALASIAQASGLGVTVEIEKLPVSELLLAHLDRAGGWPALLTQRGDIELCFTLPGDAEEGVASRAAATEVAVTRVGRLEDTGKLRLLEADGSALDLPGAGP